MYRIEDMKFLGLAKKPGKCTEDIIRAKRDVFRQKSNLFKFWLIPGVNIKLRALVPFRRGEIYDVLYIICLSAPLGLGECYWKWVVKFVLFFFNLVLHWFIIHVWK